LLLAWLILFAGVERFKGRWSGYFPLYLGLQSVVLVILLSMAEPADFFAVLFAVAGAQAMQRYRARLGAAVVAVFVPLMALSLRKTHAPADTVVLVLTYTAVMVLLSSYGLAARRAGAARARNQALLGELTDATGRLEAYSVRLERLAVARERQRLMRDLHDSVTQTIFSMTLTSRAALLLLERDPTRVGTQLERLEQQTRDAQAEMRALVSELNPKESDETLAVVLERHCADRVLRDGLAVSLQVEGEGKLSAAEERNLFRIAQEALNNVAKHSGAAAAMVRLRLSDPQRLEIEDQGIGFDPGRAKPGPGLGLEGMRERAAEIGWRLEMTSAPGAGTRLTVLRDLARSGG
jgi:signal transduction histidine kinase